MLYPPTSIQMQIFQKTEKLVYGEEDVITKVKGTEKDIFTERSPSRLNSGRHPKSKLSESILNNKL